MTTGSMGSAGYKVELPFKRALHNRGYHGGSRPVLITVDEKPPRAAWGASLVPAAPPRLREPLHRPTVVPGNLEYLGTRTVMRPSIAIFWSVLARSACPPVRSSLWLSEQHASSNLLVNPNHSEAASSNSISAHRLPASA